VHGKIGDLGQVIEVPVVVQDGAALADADCGDQAVECSPDRPSSAASLAEQRRPATEVIQVGQPQELSDVREFVMTREDVDPDRRVEEPIMCISGPLLT